MTWKESKKEQLRNITKYLITNVFQIKSEQVCIRLDHTRVIEDILLHGAVLLQHDHLVRVELLTVHFVLDLHVDVGLPLTAVTQLDVLR